MKVLPALAGVCAVLLCGPLQAGAATYHPDSARKSKAQTFADRHVGTAKAELLKQQRHSTNVLRFFLQGHRWMLASRYKSCGTVPWTGVCEIAREKVKAHRWLRRLAAARHERLYVPKLPPHYQQWLCIHQYEGSWTDSGDPYWGGLQFGSSEWQRFGGHLAPTANLATPLQQMWAAEAYWNLSGFRPWPYTAAKCGLL